MKKVMIVGCSGAGKSTLSHQLHQLTGIPNFHLDQWYWKPGWKETDKDHWKVIHKNLIEKETWILDGNYFSSIDDRLTHADTVIFLDRSTITCLYRIIKRFFSGTRSDPIEGCKEHLEWQFIHYVLIYNLKMRPRITEKLNAHLDQKSIHVLSSNRQIKRFLNNIKST